MEEEQEKKNFVIKGNAKKKVVSFGASKAKASKEEKPRVTPRTRAVSANDTPAEGKVEKKVNDNFAKHSLREPLEEGEYPRELKHQFSINTEFEAAFEKLTDGQKEGYLFYFRGPKLTASITNRIVKKIDRIMNGHGLNDCICGKSKSMPNCDGSHKNA